MLYNWNVIGHEKELKTLEDNFLNGNIHHAYLLLGPEKIGKFRVVRAAAGILQCPNNFCHKCPTCIQIEKRCHLDTIEIEDDGESIKIDAIRDVIMRLNMTTQNRYKLLLMQNISRLTDEAANCLLKTLEEPPEKTVFIFTADHLNDIKPTIASRMQIINFKKLSDETLKAALKKLHPEIQDEILDQIIILSLGRSGTAIQLLSNQEQFQELHEMYRHIQFLDEKASLSTRFAAVNDIMQDSRKMKIFLSLLVHYLRKKMLDTRNRLHQNAAIKTLEKIHKALNLLNYNVNPRLLLEDIMINI